MVVEKKRLGDLLLNFDYLRKPLSSLERQSFQGEYPYYGAQGIIDYVKEYRCDGEYLLIAEDGENLSSRNEPIAQIAIGKFWVNNHAHVVKTNSDADLRYICYALNHSDITGYVTGSAQPKLSQANLNKITLNVPHLVIQRRIASILSAYDNLIENNNRRIRLLEQMAENLYKEWFVRFRFPGYENAAFENGLPKGWKRAPLKTICEFERGKNITASEMVSGNIPVISAGISSSGTHNNSNVQGTSVTVSSSGANAGFISIHYEDIWAADCSYISEKSTKYIYYVYEVLNNMRAIVDNLQRGAAQPHVYPKDLNRITIIVPDEINQDRANKKFSQLHQLKARLLQQNEHLSRQRDLLLPRLMSGKLEVKV